jgi:hypothetical protein
MLFIGASYPDRPWEIVMRTSFSILCSLARGRAGAAFALLALVSACGSHVDPAAKASIDRQVAQLAPGKQHYGPPSEPNAAPPKEGQWVKQYVIDADGKDSFVTIKVLQIRDDKLWLETETQSYAGNSAAKVLATLGDRHDPNTIDIYEYWLKHTDGKVQQFPPALLESMKPMLRKLFASAIVSHAPEQQEDVRVAAGTFEQAYKARIKLTVLGQNVEQDAWWHSDVPLNGIVKSVGIDPSGRTELVAFGQSGARSAFP